jgi:hypothetical protein
MGPKRRLIMGTSKASEALRNWEDRQLDPPDEPEDEPEDDDWDDDYYPDDDDDRDCDFLSDQAADAYERNFGR